MLLNWDDKLTTFIRNSCTNKQWIVFVLKLHTISIDGIIWFPFVPLLVLFRKLIFNMDTPSIWMELYTGTIIAAICELLLKRIFKRSRPNLPTNSKPRFIQAENYSFPSGHAVRAFFIAAWIGNPSRVLWLWASLVGISRISAGRHYFLDVLFGAFVGISLARILDARYLIELFWRMHS
jgi:membrane-associated phospholipid phosphatase